MKRIVVTGIGTISALGLSTAEFERHLFLGHNGVTDISLFDKTKVLCNKAAEVSGYSPATYFTEKELTFYDRFAQFAVLRGCPKITSRILTGKKDISEI